MPARVKEIAAALNEITGGRLPKDLTELYSGRNPFVVMKSSNLPGKAIMETPGLVYGDPEQAVDKLAVLMTLTESAIELAGATEVGAIIAHHPLADAANSGGVTLKNYLDLYGIAVFELHEAFHGLHPGLSYLHGHAAYRVEIAYGGVPGNVLYVGKVLPEVKTLGDILARISGFIDTESEAALLAYEREYRGCAELQETNVAVSGKILLGRPEDKTEHILHVFPHTGFSPADLENIVGEQPEIDTVLASISRVTPMSPLVEKCRSLGRNFIAGSSHATEILENGLPLAVALQQMLPELEIVLFREKMTSCPVSRFGSKRLRGYADMIAAQYLLRTGVEKKE